MIMEEITFEVIHHYVDEILVDGSKSHRALIKKANASCVNTAWVASIHLMVMNALSKWSSTTVSPLPPMAVVST